MMVYETQAGLLAMIAPIVNVKLVAAVRAVTTGFSSVDNVVLQVTPSFVPRLSSTVKSIWLFAVTAVVFTTRVGLVPVGKATLPDDAAAHTAGDAPDEQLVAVLSVVRVGEQFHSVCVPVEVSGQPEVPADTVESY